MEETGKSPRLLSASLPLLEKRPDPVQTARLVGRCVSLHHLLVPWTLVSSWDELENLFEVDLELRLQDSSTSPLDPLDKLALLKVQGLIIPVLEDNNGLADAIVDPKEGQAAAGFCVGGAEVGWVDDYQNKGRKGFWGRRKGLYFAPFHNTQNQFEELGTLLSCSLCSPILFPGA